MNQLVRSMQRLAFDLTVFIIVLCVRLQPAPAILRTPLQMLILILIGTAIGVMSHWICRLLRRRQCAHVEVFCGILEIVSRGRISIAMLSEFEHQSSGRIVPKHIILDQHLFVAHIQRLLRETTCTIIFKFIGSKDLCR